MPAIPPSERSEAALVVGSVVGTVVGGVVGWTVRQEKPSLAKKADRSNAISLLTCIRLCWLHSMPIET